MSKRGQRFFQPAYDDRAYSTERPSDSENMVEILGMQPEGRENPEDVQAAGPRKVSK